MKKLDIKKNEVDYSLTTPSPAALEELLQCGICLEQMEDPKMLPCQHTFCYVCLLAIFLKETSKTENQLNLPKKRIQLKCPTCQKPFDVQHRENGLKKLPNNFYIDSLLSLCKKGTGTLTEIRCVQCQTFCQNEEKQCQHCMQTFCKICWTDHLSHLQKNLELLTNQLSQTRTKLESKLEDVEKKYLNEELRVKTFIEAKIKELRCKEEEQLEKCKVMKENEKKMAENLIDEIQHVKNSLQNLDLNSIENDIEKVVTFMNFHKETANLIDEVNKWGNENIISSEINSFQESMSTLESSIDFSKNYMIDNYRELSAVDYKLRNFIPKLVWNKCPRPAGIAVPSWAPNLLYIASTDNKVVIIMDRINFKVVGQLVTEKMSCPHGITCSKSKGEIYITDKKNNCVHVFSSTCNYIGNILTDKRMLSPEGIGILPNGNLVVSDTGNDRVLVINNQNGYEIITIIGLIDKRTTLQSPTGIAIYNDKIIVADSGNNKVKIFDANGEKILEFGNKSLFQSLDAIACDPDGNIFVGDGICARLKIFSHDGQLLRTIAGNQSNVKFSSISGIAVTPNMDIVLSDSRGRKLQIL